MTPEQLRAARAVLRMGVEELAEIAEVNPNTITRYETGKGGIHSNTRDSLQWALEREGVVFTPSNGVSAGVSLRKEPPPNIREHVVRKRKKD